MSLSAIIAGKSATWLGTVQKVDRQTDQQLPATPVESKATSLVIVAKEETRIKNFD